VDAAGHRPGAGEVKVIVTVHDVASDGGVDYIVMECISGQTLGELIGRSGMKLHDVLGYGAQIADALAAAHGAGIVRRSSVAASDRIRTAAFSTRATSRSPWTNCETPHARPHPVGRLRH
jgi:hypothetical protein